jgi:metallo-beta-lactamase family protein
MEPMAPRLTKVFLVHGEPDAQQTLKAEIEKLYSVEVICPKRGDRFEVG